MTCKTYLAKTFMDLLQNIIKACKGNITYVPHLTTVAATMDTLESSVTIINENIFITDNTSQ